MDVIELANHLRLEYLFISTEKQQLQKLNEQVFINHLFEKDSVW